MLPGSDPRLKDQAVLYSAHYDHLGIHPEQPGDNIYNGAVDNATGCGVLLEMARAYAASAQRPKRSVSVRLRHRRGAGPARLRIPRQASSRSRRQHQLSA